MPGKRHNKRRSSQSSILSLSARPTSEATKEMGERLIKMAAAQQIMNPECIDDREVDSRTLVFPGMKETRPVSPAGSSTVSSTPPPAGMSSVQQEALVTYESLLEQHDLDNDNFPSHDYYYGLLCRAGIAHPVKKISELWSQIEVNLADWIKKYPNRVSREVRQLLPCSPSDIWIFSRGMSVACSLRIMKEMEDAVVNVGLCADNMNVQSKQMGDMLEAQIANMSERAEQANNASKAISAAVREVEKMVLTVADRLLRVPDLRADDRSTVSRAPTFATAGPSTAAPQSSRKAKPRPIQLEKKGRYMCDYAEVYIGDDGTVTGFATPRQDLKGLYVLSGKKAAAAQLILQAGPSVLASSLRNEPDMIQKIFDRPKAEAAKLLKATFKHYKHLDIDWIYHP